MKRTVLNILAVISSLLMTICSAGIIYLSYREDLFINSNPDMKAMLNIGVGFMIISLFSLVVSIKLKKIFL